MNRLVAVAIVVLGLTLPAAARAQVELRNDGFETGQSAGFQAGFVSGEIAAARLVPAGPVQVTAVRLLFGGAASTQTVTLKIWDDTAGGTSPGAELFSGDFQLAGSNEAFHELDVSASNVMVPGQFRVGIVFQHSGVPSVARDDDGTIANGLNFINAEGIGWVQSSLLGLTGDWVIRAVVSGGGGAPDAGTSGTPDAGTAGGPDAGTAGGPDAGSSGGSCQGNGDCSVGEYCDSSSNTCTFDCRMDEDCPSGGTCNSLGQCLAADGDEGGCGCSTRTGGRWPAGLEFMLGLALVVMILRRRRHPQRPS